MLQYVIIRPGTLDMMCSFNFSDFSYMGLAVSIAGIICEKLEVLCPADSYSADHAAVYLDAIDFVSIR